ncbi:Dyp-type peroxidase [Amycolatopsis vastitatis]|uniref:Dyp-type peroxidase n=1 Tax=Amycolatopsis vastitatis TaxID=1905142 RepID=UPI00142D1F72|nr:Dyp-type peroxidase [Amycolatopsis vastitatis]
MATPPPLSRRALLLSAGAAGLLSACSAPAAASDPGVVDVFGAQQAGIARPAPPQRHADVSVWDVPPGARLGALLATLGRRTAALCAGGDAALADLPPARLTVTAGLGPRIVAAAGPDLPGAQDLPVFPGDDVDDHHRGGDLLLQVCADEPLVAALAVTELTAGTGLTPRWRKTGFRGPSASDGSARNVLGFADGIVVPKSDAELTADVWLDGPPAVRGGTIAVVRSMRLDTAAFHALPVTRQEQVIGRRKATAEPLSGPELDLGAKTPDGEYLIPADAHIRRAHPLTVGAGVMLRRSYNSDEGLLFISFQKELRTFVATQHRMSDGDALLRYATTTASATFLILPGFSADVPLGHGLLA